MSLGVDWPLWVSVRGWVVDVDWWPPVGRLGDVVAGVVSPSARLGVDWSPWARLLPVRCAPLVGVVGGVAGSW